MGWGGAKCESWLHHVFDVGPWQVNYHVGQFSFHVRVGLSSQNVLSIMSQNSNAVCLFLSSRARNSTVKAKAEQQTMYVKEQAV